MHHRMRLQQFTLRVGFMMDDRLVLHAPSCSKVGLVRSMLSFETLRCMWRMVCRVQGCGSESCFFDGGCEIDQCGPWGLRASRCLKANGKLGVAANRRLPE